MKLLTLALMLLPSFALADKVEPLDMCLFQQDALRAENASLQQEIARLKMQFKYRLGEGDGVDTKTLEIKRAAKPAAAPKSK